MTELSVLAVTEATRRAQRRTLASLEAADLARAERDTLIRTLHTDYALSYGRISASVGVSRGLVALICRTKEN